MTEATIISMPPTAAERIEFWRKNAEAFVQSMGVMVAALERDGKADEATNLKVWALMPWEAALRDDQSGDLWPTCEACGMPIKGTVTVWCSSLAVA